MSDFPEIKPFGPRPSARHGREEIANQQFNPPVEPVPPPNITAAVVTAFGVGFILGYLAFRNEERILRQTKLDRFLDHADEWIRKQGSKITTPIQQGLELTGATVDQAFKSRGSSIDNLIKKVRSRIFH
jgi:hypothetical protein